MEQEKIVIYTGSFNPVTKGHMLVLECAMEKVNADKGMFIITPNNALTRKMMSKYKSKFILSEETREEMIESLKSSNEKICFGGKEIGGLSPSSAKTVNRVLRSNKNALIYYLIGADKLHSLSHWTDIDSIIDKITLVVAARAGYDIEEEIEKDEWLMTHKDKFIVINPSEEAFGISSSEVRRRFMNREDYHQLLEDGPNRILNTFKPEDFPKITMEDLIKFELLYKSFSV